MKKRIISLLSPLLLVASASANWQPNDYIKRHCTGQKHHPLSAEVQVDCFTDSHVIKYDWDKDWLNSLSQVLLQSTLSGKKAGMMVLSTDAEQTSHISKLQKMVEKHQLPVDVWLVNPVKVSIVNISQLEKAQAKADDSGLSTSAAVAAGAVGLAAGAALSANKNSVTEANKVKPIVINSAKALASKKRQVGASSTVKVSTPTGTKLVSSNKPSSSNKSFKSNIKSSSYKKASNSNKYKSSGKFYKSSSSRSKSNNKDYSKMESQPSY